MDVKISFNHASKELNVILPTCSQASKVRIKSRDSFSQIGSSVAGRSVTIPYNAYAEWQIGYDLLANNENKNRTSISHLSFVNNKGQKKYPYELSEIIYYSLSLNYLSSQDVLQAIQGITSFQDNQTFEELYPMSRIFQRTEEINHMLFSQFHLSAPPIWVYEHRNCPGLLTEIQIKDKQIAIGSQAMLYVCLDLNFLKFQSPVFNRTFYKDECAIWPIQAKEAKACLQIFKQFGLLSPKHKKDVCEILKVLLT